MSTQKATRNIARKSKLFHLSYEGKKALYGYCFILPWIIGFIIFFLRPFITSLIYSFNDITFVQNGMELTWNNFRVYQQFILEDPDLLKNLVGVFANLLYEVPIIVIISVMIAVLLNDKYPGKTFFRAVFFLPVILSGGAALDIIRGDPMASVMLEGQKMGSMLEITNIQTIIQELQLPTELSEFLTKTANSMFNLLWKCGLQILIFLAAIQTISPSIYEASKIEGASSWDNFWKITMPMISPMIILSVIYSIIDSFTNVSQNIIINQMVSDAQYLKYTHASVLAVLYFSMAMAFIGIVFAVLNKALPDTSTRR